MVEQRQRPKDNMYVIGEIKRNNKNDDEKGGGDDGVGVVEEMLIMIIIIFKRVTFSCLAHLSNRNGNFENNDIIYVVF